MMNTLSSITPGAIRHESIEQKVPIHRTLSACLLSIVIISPGCSSNDDRDSNHSSTTCRVVELAADLWPGVGQGDPDNLVAFGDRLYFKANDGVHGEELWSYHPEAGTERLLDIAPGSGGSVPGGLVVLDGMLYFSADDGVLGRELWGYDPAEPAAGAEQVADINPGSGGSDPGELIALNGNLYFEADDGEHGRELWVYDADAGAALLADLRPGVRGSFGEEYTVVDGRLYFRARDDQASKLWLLDPAAGSVMPVVISTYPAGRDIYPADLTALNGTLYFSADDGIHGRELWAHDSVTGAVLVADINPGSESGSIDGLIVIDEKLYMAANEVGSGDERHNYILYRYDPTNGVAIAAFMPTVVGFSIRNAYSFTVLEGTLYFLAYDAIHGEELWRYNPVTGAELVVDTVPGLGGTGDDDPEPPSRLRVFDGKLYFTAFDNASDYRRAQWVLDPVTGAQIVTEPWPGSGIDEIPWRTTQLSSRLYFNAEDDEHGRELWVYDPGCVK